MKNTVWVGILIPTYKRKDYLERSLHSVLKQSYRELEIIVIDNGSAGDTGQLITRLNDPRIRYIQNEHDIGLIGSIRKGMQLFSDRVTWCTILPDDDLLDREFINSMVGYVDHHPDIDVIHGHRRMIDAAGGVLGEASLPPEKETAVEYLVARSQFIRQTFLVGVFFSRSTYTQVGGYPQFTSGMASDDALIFGLSLKQGLYFNKNAIASVRMHPEAESHSSSDARRHIRSFMDFQNHIMRMLATNDTFTRSDLETIRRVLKKYARISISGLWLRRVHALLSNGLASPDKELSDLYKLAKANEYPFSLRVRVEAFFASTLHWNPELNPRYHRLLDVLRLLLKGWGRRS